MSGRIFIHHMMVLCFIQACSAFPQEREAQNYQFWFDYIPTYPMGRWTFDSETGPRVILGEQDWWEISIKPNWEYSDEPFSTTDTIFRFPVIHFF